MIPVTRKQEIINAASQLFREKGFSAVTMRDIATAMGMKAASLYNHIQSKQEILKLIIISLAEEFTDGMNAIKSSGESSIEKIKKIIALHVRITGSNTSGMASLNHDWMHLQDQLKYYLTLRVNYENSFRDIIQDGIDQDEFIDSNVDIMLFSILSTLRSLYLWIPQMEDLDTDELAGSLSRVLLKGIMK